MDTPNYILALNLSANSVTFACIETNSQEKPQKVLDIGGHCFVPAVDLQSGLTLNRERKLAQNAKNRRNSVSKRLNDLRKSLSDNGVVSPNNWKKLNKTNVWFLRCQALERKLTANEWGAVLLHIVKNRGVSEPRNSTLKKSEHIVGSKNKRKLKNKYSEYELDQAKVIHETTTNSQLIKDRQFRTPAEIAVKKFLSQKDGFIRNRANFFHHAFVREDIYNELKYLFTRQRELGNQFAGENLQSAVEDIFLRKDKVSSDYIQEQIGFCSLEENQYRAAKHSYSYEKFVLLQKLSDLQIYDTQENQYFFLADDEIDKIKKAIFRDEIRTRNGNRLSNGVLKYSDIRKILSLQDNELFKQIKYIPFDKWKQKNRYKDAQDYLFDQENTTFVEMPFYAGVRSALWVNHRNEWQKICNQPEIMDKIGKVFLYYKNDADIIDNLPDILSDSAKQALTVCDFSGVGNLSFKALRKLIVEMEKGKNYGEAKDLLYSKQSNSNKTTFLPKFNQHQVRNPVLFQALSEARFILNSLIKKWGTPLKVQILTNRDLAKKEQSIIEIQKEQEKNRKNRQKAIEEFQATFPRITPNENDLLKFKLWEEQNKICLYSGEKIDKSRLLDNNYADIDHAIPFSRSANNTQDNKVLSLVRENRAKGSMTPYEYLKGQDWNDFVRRVENSRFSSVKKQLLLWQKIYKNQLSGSLNDGSMAATILATWIEKHLRLNTQNNKSVLTIKQGVADFLANEWQIKCAGSLEQQAVFAAVTACATEFFQSLISEASQIDDNRHNDYWDNKVGERTKFPLPYPQFKNDVLQKLQNWSLSSHAVTKTHGKAHNDKIYNSSGYVKISINDASIEQIEYLKKREPQFYNALKEWIKKRDDNLRKYKQEMAEYRKLPFRQQKETPRPHLEKMQAFYKPSKTGKQVIVRYIKISKPESKPSISLLVRGGIAALSTPLRLDIYTDSNNKQYFVPVFAHQIAKKIRPNLAVFTDKDAPMKDWQQLDDDKYKFSYSLNRGDFIEIADKTNHNDNKLMGIFMAFSPEKRTIILRPISGEIPEDVNELGFIEVAIKKRLISKC